VGAIRPKNLPNRCQVSDGGGPVVDKGDMGLTVPGFSSSDAAASGAELRTRGSSQSGEAPARGYNASRAPIGWR